MLGRFAKTVLVAVFCLYCATANILLRDLLPNHFAPIKDDIEALFEVILVPLCFALIYRFCCFVDNVRGVDPRDGFTWRRILMAAAVLHLSTAVFTYLIHYLPANAGHSRYAPVVCLAILILHIALIFSAAQLGSSLDCREDAADAGEGGLG